MDNHDTSIYMVRAIANKKSTIIHELVASIEKQVYVPSILYNMKSRIDA